MAAVLFLAVVVGLLAFAWWATENYLDHGRYWR